MGANGAESSIAFVQRVNADLRDIKKARNWSICTPDRR